MMVRACDSGCKLLFACCRDAERERKTREIMQDLEEIQHESKKERRRNK